MIRFVLRVLALLLLASAFAAAVIDGTRSIAADRVALTPLGVALATLSPAREAQTVASLRALPPHWLWPGLVSGALALPLFAALAALGLFVLALARPRRALIGYSSRD